MRRRSTRCAALAAAICLAAGAGVSGPEGRPSSGPESNLDYWLGQATTSTAPTTTAPATNPMGGKDSFEREDALPGVLVLSDGTVHAGGIFTTRDKDLEVWVESEQRWRHVPAILLLSLEAVVVEEGMELEWRWKEMGLPEKVYTGRKKPVRRFLWRLHLIDDTYITGAIKGQPLWIETRAKRLGPFVLHERSAGKYGQELTDLVYVKRVVISRAAMTMARKRPADD